MIFDIENENIIHTLVMRHVGTHDHLRPVINIPDPISKSRLKSVVQHYPDRKPLKLVIGQSIYKSELSKVK